MTVRAAVVRLKGGSITACVWSLTGLYWEQENIPPQYGYAERAVNMTLGVHHRGDIAQYIDM